MRRTQRWKPGVGLFLVGLCAMLLWTSTKPVEAAQTDPVTQNDPISGDDNSWTWTAAGREAITWAVCGAVAGGGTTAVFGTPAATVGAVVGAGAGAVGGFLTYAAGQAYDALFGLEQPVVAPPPTSLD